MINDLIAYCGVDCSACADRSAGKCSGCRQTVWKAGDICLPAECCGKQAISYCGECPSFPCADMKEFYAESKSHERAYALMLSVRREALRGSGQG